MSGDINFAAQGLHNACPHGIVRTALTLLVRLLSHAGHMIVSDSVDELDLATVLKLMVISDLSERLCLFSGEEAGHKGDSFGGFASCRLFVDGVREGTQKEGRVGLADLIESAYEKRI